LITSKPNLPSTDWVMNQWWTRGGKPVSSSMIDEVLQKAGARVGDGAVIQSPGSALGTMSPTQYLLHHGFTQLTSYQPASRSGPFNGSRAAGCSHSPCSSWGRPSGWSTAAPSEKSGAHNRGVTLGHLTS